MNKTMKKFIFIIILGVFGMVVLATPVSAATTLSLSPLSINITEGKSSVLRVTINPRGVKNYTAKVHLQYPADLLKVKSFTFGSGWMALSQPEYDLIDNTNGVLIKTAGYPGGISKLITFGTVSFSAKKTGKGIIKIGEDSLVLDVANQNVPIVSLAQTSVTIAAPPLPEAEVLPPEEEVLPPEEEVLPPEEEIVPEEEVFPPEEEIVPEEEVLPEEEIVPEEEAPSLFDVLIEPVAKQFREGPSVFFVTGLVLIIVIIGYILYRKRKKDRSN